MAPRDGGVLISVEDDGPGVPVEIREAIFEPFRQGPTASPHSPGTGIGLSLVARFAELHGGRAWVDDRDGGGAAFHVFLPGRPGPAPSLGAREGASSARRRRPGLRTRRRGVSVAQPAEARLSPQPSCSVTAS